MVRRLNPKCELCLVWLLATTAIGGVALQAAETVSLKFVTVRTEEGEHVSVNAIYCDRNGKYYLVHHVEEEQLGRYRVTEFAWNPNDRVVVLLESVNLYNAPDPEPVRERVDFTVDKKMSWRGPTSLEERNLWAYASMRNSPADEVAIFTELARRTEASYPEVSLASKQRVWTAAGRVLDVDSPMDYDGAQGQFVPSVELTDALVVYQGERDKLPLTSQFDGPTVRAFSGRPQWHYLYQVEAAAASGPLSGRPELPVDFTRRIEVLGDSTMAVLAINAERAEASRRFGLSALLMNELAARLREYGSAEAAELAVGAAFETIQALGRELAVAEPSRYDPVQRRFVISPSLAVGLEEFQVERGLEPTGTGDYATLRVLAGVEGVSPYLSGVRLSGTEGR